MRTPVCIDLFTVRKPDRCCQLSALSPDAVTGACRADIPFIIGFAERGSDLMRSGPADPVILTDAVERALIMPVEDQVHPVSVRNQGWIVQRIIRGTAEIRRQADLLFLPCRTVIR